MTNQVKNPAESKDLNLFPDLYQGRSQACITWESVPELGLLGNYRLEQVGFNLRCRSCLCLGRVSLSHHAGLPLKLISEDLRTCSMCCRTDATERDSALHLFSPFHICSGPPRLHALLPWVERSFWAAYYRAPSAVTRLSLCFFCIRCVQVEWVGSNQACVNNTPD